MPKRRPSQSKRRRGRRPPPPVATAQQQPVRPLAAVAPATAPATAAEPSVTRFTTRDYGYVRREIIRIAVLATAILIAIVVLSFFLP